MGTCTFPYESTSRQFTAQEPVPQAVRRVLGSAVVIQLEQAIVLDSYAEEHPADTPRSATLGNFEVLGAHAVGECGLAFDGLATIAARTFQVGGRNVMGPGRPQREASGRALAIQMGL